MILLRQNHNTILKFLIVFITITCIKSSPSSLSNDLFHCPDECICTLIINENNQSYNQAKCHGLNGLNDNKDTTKFFFIHSLDLSNNNLTKIPNILYKFKNLTNLDLSSNKLLETEKFGKRIQKLNLSKNHITSDKLHNLPKYLKYLDLSYNKITYLPIELKNLKFLRSIELTGNEIYCTCDTLNIRNWLQNNHVWTNKHIKCTYPIELKGKSWLQVRQSDVCHDDNGNSTATTHASSKVSVDDDNELMLGDEAFPEDGSGDVENVEELGTDYLLINNTNAKKSSDYKVDETANIEGSGGEDIDVISELDNANVPSLAPLTVTENEDHTSESTQIDENTGNEDHTSESTQIDENTRNEDHTSEGTQTDENAELEFVTTEASGSGPLPTLPVDIEIDNDDNAFSSSTSKKPEEIEGNLEEQEEKEVSSPSPLPSESVESSTELSTTTSTATPEDIFKGGLGIVQFPNILDTTPSTSTESPAEPITEEQEPLIVAVSVNNVESQNNPITPGPDNTNIMKENIKVVSAEELSPVAEGNSGANQSTYVLLGIILFILVLLIMFVAIKRSRARRQSGRHQDVENAKATELIDMDKKNLGKPIHKNGATTERAPLINDRTKSDLAKPISLNGKKAPFDANDKDKNAQEPLLKKNDTTSNNIDNKSPQTESNNNNVSSKNTLNKQIKPTDSVEELTAIEEQKPQPAVRQTPISRPTTAPPVHQYKTGSYPRPQKSKPSSGDEGETGDDYHPTSSPRPARYSPVYSPETGRVKIKLTETPKPKTPLLITRSRSNAGDITIIPTIKTDTFKDATATPPNSPSSQ